VAATRSRYLNLLSQKANVLKLALEKEILVETLEGTMIITMVAVKLQLAAKEIKTEALKEVTVIKSMIW